MSMKYYEADSGRCGAVSRTISGDHESRVTDTGGIIVRCIVDMMGGKPSCHVCDGNVSPTITRGRGSGGDMHLIDKFHAQTQSL